MENKDHPAPFFVGTSGWTYDHWKGIFYPAGLTRSHWFDFYARRFNSVEINATFYRAFKDQTYQTWKSRAPEGFRYALKVPKTITHRKLLRDVEADIQAFCHSAAQLDDTFQMVLLQISPNTPYDHGLLRSALQAFPDPTRVAVEFRAGYWFNPHTENILSSLGSTFCNVDSPRQRMTDVLTSDRAYLRLHGRDQWYTSDYREEDLQQIAGIAHKLVSRGARQVNIYFNNDFGGFAPVNAHTLAGMLAE